MNGHELKKLAKDVAIKTRKKLTSTVDPGDSKSNLVVHKFPGTTKSFESNFCTGFISCYHGFESQLKEAEEINELRSILKKHGLESSLSALVDFLEKPKKVDVNKSGEKMRIITYNFNKEDSKCY